MRRLKHRVVWAGVFGLGVLAGIFLCAKLDILPIAAAVNSPENFGGRAEQSSGVLNIENAVINVAERVGPAVVSITVEHAEKT